MFLVEEMYFVGMTVLVFGGTKIFDSLALRTNMNEVLMVYVLDVSIIDYGSSNLILL